MRLDLLAALAGVLVALQSRINGELALRLNNSLEAAIISFGTGLIVVTAISIFIPGVKTGTKKLIAAVRARELPKVRLFAGSIGATFVAVQTQIVPILGVAIFSVAAIAGQTAVSLGVDRWGLTGGGKKEITTRRVIAAILTIIAVLVSVWDRINAENLSLFAVVLGILAGAIVGVQRAFNGQINEKSQQSFTTSLLNFITGMLLLIFLMCVGLLTHHAHLSAIPHMPWWLYSGGTIGVFYIAFASTIVQHLGVLTFTLFTVGGQLLGSLLIDVFAPTAGVHISWYLISGIVMTYLGVIVSGSGQSRFARK